MPPSRQGGGGRSGAEEQALLKKTEPGDLDRLVSSLANGKSGDITLHQLRIFSAVARSETLTRASKLVGLAQPSLSQQLSKLEASIGTRLFDRVSHQMVLTDAGHYLLRKAELILRSMQEAEDGLAEFGDGSRVTIRIAGINSVLRVILPLAMRRMQERYPKVEFDVHESAPADTLELLYSRRVNIGLVAAGTIAKASAGFMQVPILVDPYVFAVPRQLDLGRGVACQDDLTAENRALINRAIQFNFGTQHTQRVQEWYDRYLPQHHVIAQCRSFEVALGMVRTGLGVCLAPALAALNGSQPLEGVALYRVPEPDRSIVALVPSQYRYMEPYGHLIETLQAVGRDFVMPALQDAPALFDTAVSISEPV